MDYWIDNRTPTLGSTESGGSVASSASINIFTPPLSSVSAACLPFTQQMNQAA